jgi:hypothetical protein
VISHACNNTEIVRNQDHTGARYLFEFLYQLKNLGLDSDVEGCRRLISYQQFGFA